MIPALRLTTMLLWTPIAAAFALQATPPVPPRPAPAPRIEPRPPKPRVDTPRPDGWRDFELKKSEWIYEMPDMRFEKLEKLEKLEHFDMPKLDLESRRFDIESRKLDIESRKFEALESRLHDLDMRRDDLAFKSEHFLTTPRADAAWRRESFSSSPRAPWLQGDPADSLYRSAYELLNRGEWRRAASAFASIPQRFPSSGYAADALYWQAFALYRIGGTDDLRTALRSLETMRSKYPQAKTQSDAAALTTRVRGALAARGDANAREAIQKDLAERGEQACDREDQAVRSEAIKSLAQTDPGSLNTIVKRVLAKKDVCSAPLRRTAVYLLGNSGDSEAPAILRDVALNDSEPEVRSTALQYLARSPSDVAVNTLDEVLRTSTDQGVLRTAARALAANPNPRAKQSVRALIERADAPERLRIEAVSGFENSERTTDEDAAWLRSVYQKIDNPRVKARIARVVGQLGGDQNDQWLLGLMRNNDEPLEVRNAALQRVASRNMPIADAVKLYGSVSDRQLREQLISVYTQRKEPEATDKLLDIAKNDTDYNLRRQAINALTRKNDPRAMKLLLEIIDK
jgi:HEAT repeat protein